MKRRRFFSLKGFTLVEVIVASGIAVVVLGAAFAVSVYVHRVWNIERTRSTMLGDMQIAMERMKQEAMLSDGNKTLTAYDGISFPRAKDDGRDDSGYHEGLDGDGFIETDSSTGKIWWDETIVYHIYNTGTSYELRKTVFTPRNNTITTPRQAQLETVIADGDGASAQAQDENATTYTIISGLKNLTLDISPKALLFDGYASSTKRSNNVSFGSALIGPGYHTITFEVVDKNDDSTDYRIGIDSFSITPSGCVREAEDYITLVHLDGSDGISSSSEDPITKEEMTSYGVWGGNYQLEYGSGCAGDFITLRVYYDLWMETNFNQGSLDNVVVKFSNENGAGGASGDNDYVLSLEGNETEATGGTKSSLDITPGSGDYTTYRVIISLPSNGRLCSIKFSAGTNASLTIEEAYISEIESGQDGGKCYPITFNNCDLDPRNSGQDEDVMPYNGGVGITIPAEEFGWSNWVSIDDSATADDIEYFESSKKYFVTFYIKGLGTDESMSIAYRQGDSTRSYTWAGDHAGTETAEPGSEDWGTSGTEDKKFYGIEEVAVRYIHQGTYTSEIYDTGMDDPQFDRIIWNIKRNNSPDANILLKARSNDSYDTLAGDSDWTDEFSIDTNSTTGNASIGALADGRFVQFQAEFYSYESDEDSSHQTNDTDTGDEYDDDEDYDMSCILEDVTITWPGQQRSVDVSGYYTLKPNYGEFTVKIDGNDLNKGLEIKPTTTMTTYHGKEVTCSLNTEIEFRNTDK